MKLAVTAMILILLLLPWAYSGYKLYQCSINDNYKCEVVHAIGVVMPLASYVTVWFEHDNEINNN